ncbi:NUDIX hydrolase [Streptomyces sp. V4-01]|uniref:NUDIX hydrolase n=1 Tax=Actinacidiphila polyblastidii TaxID=3110430 RepID=A0ABU7PEJ4_9ACTN|nr:NUDIX hydrolase [Streptomyces sp. V4-01]
MAHPFAPTKQDDDRHSLYGQWLILDDEGHVLVVNPAFGGPAGKFRLVGGGALVNEAPHLTAIRTAHIEVGLNLVPDTLLLTDYAPRDEESGRCERTTLVFLHHLTPADAITLNTGTPLGAPAPLSEYRFLDEDQLEDFCAPYMVRRIRAALEAAPHGPTARGYLYESRQIAYVA